MASNTTPCRRLAVWCLFVAMLLTFPAFSAIANQMVAWGNSTNVPIEANRAVAVSAGWDYSLAIAPNGSLIDWGNDPGVPAPAMSNLVAVAASHAHSLALQSDGTVVVWGAPYRARLWANIPDGLTNAVAISANGDEDGEQSLVLKKDGTVVAWGNVSDVPEGLSNVVAIAAGGWHELALQSNGTVVAWGDDAFGQTDLPADLTNIVAIAAGGFHSLALKSDGTVAAWGWDGEGELDVPAGLSNVVAVAAGTYHSIALKSDGTVVAWGFIDRIDSSPAAVPAGLTNVVAVSAGISHSLAITIPLQITSIVLTNQNSLLRFHTFSGQQYNVEYSPDLSPGSWTPLPAGSFSGNGHDITVTDTNATTSSPVRYYRLKQ